MLNHQKRNIKTPVSPDAGVLLSAEKSKLRHTCVQLVSEIVQNFGAVCLISIYGAKYDNQER
jgi:hypothetical protein